MNLHLRRQRGAHLTPVPETRQDQRPMMDATGPAAMEPIAADVPAVTTPFEDWCEAHGVHPETLGAWETFAFERAQGA